jgi:hypothetical protein
MTIVPHPLDAESADTGRPIGGGPRMESSHVSALQSKHAGIDRQLREEMCRPLPDGVVIQSLKKQKLRIKEEIARH